MQIRWRLLQVATALRLSCKAYQAPCLSRCSIQSTIHFSAWARGRTLRGHTSPLLRRGWPASSFRSQFSPHLLWEAFPNPRLGSGLPLNSHSPNMGISWFLAMSPHKKVISVRSGRAGGWSPAVDRAWHTLGANKS